MVSGQATCRAGWTRHIFAGLAQLPKDRATKVQSLIRPEDLTKLDNTPPLTWLPLDIHMSVLGALRSVLGAVEYRRYCNQRIAGSLDNRLLLAGVVRAALQLFGASPWAGLKSIPASLPHILREAGRVRVTIADDESTATLFYDDLPVRFAQDDVWPLIWLGTIETVTDYALKGRGLKCSATTTLHEPERGNFAWTAKLVEPAVSDP